MVKTPPFHGGNTGSNPVGITTKPLYAFIVLNKHRKSNKLGFDIIIERSNFMENVKEVETNDVNEHYEPFVVYDIDDMIFATETYCVSEK